MQACMGQCWKHLDGAGIQACAGSAGFALCVYRGLPRGLGAAEYASAALARSFFFFAGLVGWLVGRHQIMCLRVNCAVVRNWPSLVG